MSKAARSVSQSLISSQAQNVVNNSEFQVAAPASCVHVPGEGHGYPRPTDLAGLAMAKCVCGASDWHRATRVPGPVADLWRGAPATSSCFLWGVLQSGAHALGLRQGCAPGSGGPAVRCHCRHPNLVWAAPPLRPDMIFGKDRAKDSFESHVRTRCSGNAHKLVGYFGRCFAGSAFQLKKSWRMHRHINQQLPKECNILSWLTSLVRAHPAIS